MEWKNGTNQFQTNPSKSVKFPSVKINANLKWKYQILDVASKLDKTTTIFYRIKNYVTSDTLKAIYFSIFDLHINYANLMLGQSPNPTFRISISAQKKIFANYKLSA